MFARFLPWPDNASAVAVLVFPPVSVFETGGGVRGVRHRSPRDGRAAATTCASAPSTSRPSTTNGAGASPSTRRTGLDALRVGRHVILPGWPRPKTGRRRPRSCRRVAAGPPPWRPVRLVLLGRLRAGRRRPARRRAGHDALDVRRRAAPASTRRSTSTRACSTSATVRCSRRPARRRPSTSASTSCGSTTAPRSPTSSPGAWWCRPTATAARRSTCEAPVPDVRATTTSPARSTGRSPTSTRTSTVDDLARRARHVAPHVRPPLQLAPGTTPLQWLLTQRVVLAQRLLEGTDLPIEVVAERCGLRVGGHAPAALRPGGRHGAAGVPPDVPPRQLSRAAPPQRRRLRRTSPTCCRTRAAAPAREAKRSKACCAWGTSQQRRRARRLRPQHVGERRRLAGRHDRVAGALHDRGTGSGPTVATPHRRCRLVPVPASAMAIFMTRTSSSSSSRRPFQCARPVREVVAVQYIDADAVPDVSAIVEAGLVEPGGERGERGQVATRRAAGDLGRGRRVAAVRRRMLAFPPRRPAPPSRRRRGQGMVAFGERR